MMDVPLPIQHEQRIFTSAPGSKYMLPADELEKQRLNFQHDLLTRLYGGRLIFAPTAIPRGASILDCGAGTGAWTMELVRKLPCTTRFYGIDIEPRNFPVVARDLQDRIQLSVAFATSLPWEWTDKFDLVHQRLFVAALQQHEWDAAVRELLRVAKPGGWVQLMEYCGWRGYGPASEKVLELLQHLWLASETVYDIALRLPKMLQDAGFEQVQVEKRGMPLGKWAGQFGIDGRDNLIGTLRGLKRAVLKGVDLRIVGSEAEYDELIDELEREWDEHPAAVLDVHCIIAQKPPHPSTDPDFVTSRRRCPISP